MSRTTLELSAARTAAAPQTASKIPWHRGWLPLALLPVAVDWFMPTDWPRWAWMWSLAAAIYFGFKWLTWRREPNHDAPPWRQAGYLLAWPGKDVAAFLDVRRKPARPTAGEWLLATGKLAVGLGLVYGVAHRVPGEHPVLVGWLGIVGVVLALHFGLFHLLSCAWRRAGVEARPLMNWPIRAVSISDFWRRRWNIAFHDLAHRFLFVPLAPLFGPRTALLLGFVASGLVHELLISLPARGGYGGPTLFFLLQAFAILLERSRVGRRLGLGAGPRGWLFTMAVLVIPLPLLFHVPFLTRVILPMLRAMGSSLMNTELLTRLIFAAGIVELCIPVASLIVPFQLDWRREFQKLPALHRQLYWVYGGYTLLSIVAIGAIALVNAPELADRSVLARCFCLYGFAFWGIRLALQAVLDVGEHLDRWWLRLGYYALTVAFAYLTFVFGWAAFGPR